MSNEQSSNNGKRKSNVTTINSHFKTVDDLFAEMRKNGAEAKKALKNFEKASQELGRIIAEEEAKEEMKNNLHVQPRSTF